MPRKHNARVMGHTIFVPLDPSLDVEITNNFYTGTCELCKKSFHAWKRSKYCCPSHKTMAHRKRKQQEMSKELEFLRARVKELEGKNND